MTDCTHTHTRRMSVTGMHTHMQGTLLMARNTHRGVCSPFYIMRNEYLLPILKTPKLALVMHTRNLSTREAMTEAVSSGLHSKALSLCPPK